MGSLLARHRRECSTETAGGSGCDSDRLGVSPQELQPPASTQASPSRKDDDCLRTYQVFVKDLKGATRCADVREGSTVEELMAHLQREKILPPGGSLFAGPRKLKKSQLMENVPCNIEVVLALNGGAPPKATKPGKRDSVKSQTGKLVQSWLSGNVIETKGSKVNAEELRRRIEESMPEGHNLSKQQLGRILSAIYQKRVRHGHNGRKATREYYYYGIELMVVENEEDMKSLPTSDSKSEEDKKSLPTSDSKSEEEIRALKSDNERMKERVTILQGEVDEQLKAKAKLEDSKSKLKDQLQSEVARRKNAEFNNDVFFKKLVAVNEENNMLYAAVSKHTGKTFVTRLEDIPSPYIHSREFLVDVKKTSKYIGRGSFGMVCKVNVPLVGEVASKSFEDNGRFDKNKTRKQLLKELNMLRALEGTKGVQKLVGCVIEALPYNLLTIFEGQEGVSTTIDYIITTRPMDFDSKSWCLIVLDLCRVLAKVHMRGILHCDLKPNNIIILHDKTAKIIDFGQACLLSEARKMSKPLSESEYPWIAPEVCLGEQAPSTASDIFSLGFVVWKILKKCKKYATCDALSHISEECRKKKMERPCLTILKKTLQHSVENMQ